MPISSYICVMRINDNSTDTFLLELLKQGNISAYEAVFTRYYSTLCAYAKLFLKSADVCENIVQELMLWIWEHHSELRITDSLSNYLFTATRNRALKHISHEMVERRILDEMHKKLHGQFESPDFYIVKELESRIQAAIAALPDSYRQAFEMNRYEKKTYNEIAEALGISPKTVDYRIQQALKLLRTTLKDYLPLAAAFLILKDIV